MGVVKLYFFNVAPNPTKVRLYLAEKAAGGHGLGVEEVPVSIRKGEHRSPEFLARNPLGKMPVLELDDGTHLIESLAIIEYLEELHPEPPMVGLDPAERANQRELERVAELGVLEPVVYAVLSSGDVPGRPALPAVEAFFRERLPRSLSFLEQRLSDGRPFLAGERPTVADCTLAAAMQFFRYGKLDLDAELEHLARWDRRYREREPARAVLRY